MAQRYMGREPGQCLACVVAWRDIVDDDQWLEGSDEELEPANVESAGYIPFVRGGEDGYLILVRDWSPDEERWAWRRCLPFGTVKSVELTQTGETTTDVDTIAQRLREAGEVGDGELEQ